MSEKVWFEGSVEEAVNKGFATEETMFLIGVMSENGVKRIFLSSNPCSNFADIKIKMIVNEDETEGYVEILEEE